MILNQWMVMTPRALLVVSPIPQIEYEANDRFDHDYYHRSTIVNE
jgi:hypothetical protein